LGSWKERKKYSEKAANLAGRNSFKQLQRFSKTKKENVMEGGKTKRGAERWRDVPVV
jgi:hypothetical protein